MYYLYKNKTLSNNVGGKIQCKQIHRYSVSLVAETTTGAMLSIERTAGQGQSQAHLKGIDSSQQGLGLGGGELPEEVGKEAALMLLDEITKSK